MSVPEPSPTRRVPVLGRLLALLAGGCAAPEVVPPAPPLGVVAEHFAGDVYTGPVLAEPSLDAPPWSVTLEVAYVEQLPDEAGEPLGTHVRQAFVPRSAEVLRPRSELGRGVTVATPAGPPRDALWRATHAATLWPGTSVRFVVVHDPLFEAGTTAGWEELALQVARPHGDAAPLQVALTFEGPVPDGAAGDRTASVREHVVLDGVDPALGIRLLVPSPTATTRRSGSVLELRVAQGEPVDAERADRGRAAVGASLERLAESSRGLDEALAFRFERTHALEALDRGPLRRSALVFLADSAGAHAAGELAIVADEPTLAAFLQDLRDALATTEEQVQGVEAFGWFLEHRTYLWLARRAASLEDPPPAEVRSLLVRLAGELGRYPDLVEETVRGCDGFEQLGQRLETENRIFLEDSHPAARVRAYDWLAARGAAPEGYDPLAARDARRAALAAAEERP